MNQDTHGSNAEEWIGFDLDGTLAKYDGWKGIEHIGEPVASMVVIAKMLHRLGKKIKILTARVAPRDDGEGGDKAKKYVEEWCQKNLGFVPEITYEKDASMAALFDDRAVAVEQNTGKVLGGWPDALPKASDKAKNALLKTEKKAGFDLRNGNYDHVRNVFDQLSYRDRRFVAPTHPEFYGSAKPVSRTVAYDSGEPVGFSDTFDEEKFGGEKGKRRASVEIAVLEAARGKGIARKMAIRSIKKAIGTGKFDDIDWNIVHGNKASEELAKKLGFKRMGWHWHPRYSIKAEDFQPGKKASFDPHERLVKVVMRKNPGFSKNDAEAYISDGRLHRELSEKMADSRPSKEDLWRMYDIMQADARLAKKIEGLGFGRSGDSYRKAAIKLKVMELARVVKDGKRIRNNIAHMPGYVPSRHDAERALRQYTEAEKKVDDIASE